MIGSAASFAVMMGIVRHLSESFHPLELVFFRNLFGFLFVLPWLLRAGGLPRTRRFGGHLVRAAFGLSAMICYFVAMALVPLADAVAITFAAPLFATAGAAMLLGERVRAHRWTATIVGFVGTVIVLNPGPELLSPGALAALGAAVFMAAAILCIKSLARTEHPTTIVFYFGLLLTPLSAVAAAFVWVTPSLEHWPWLLGLGLFATTGQLLLTHAFAAADASFVLPFDFSRLVFAAVVGFAFFNETPDVWTWVGAAVIVVASSYVAHREHRILKASKPYAPEPGASANPPT